MSSFATRIVFCDRLKEILGAFSILVGERRKGRN